MKTLQDLLTDLHLLKNTVETLQKDVDMIKYIFEKVAIPPPLSSLGMLVRPPGARAVRKILGLSLGNMTIKGREGFNSPQPFFCPLS